MRCQSARRGVGRAEEVNGSTRRTAESAGIRVASERDVLQLPETGQERLPTLESKFGFAAESFFCRTVFAGHSGSFCRSRSADRCRNPVSEPGVGAPRNPVPEHRQNGFCTLQTGSVMTVHTARFLTRPMFRPGAVLLTDAVSTDAAVSAGDKSADTQKTAAEAAGADSSDHRMRTANSILSVGSRSGAALMWQRRRHAAVGDRCSSGVVLFADVR